MNVTNKHCFPEEVYKALAKNTYNPGSSDYSVTTIIKPPRIVQLERRHWDELEEDVIDRVWSLFGSAAHSILEGHGSDDSLTEERLYTTVHGRKIGGQVDHYKGGVITDYKVTSAWTIVYGSRINEWEEQLNVYAQIFSDNGHPVERLQVVAILRDWDKKKAAQDYNYPQTPVMVIPLNLWPEAGRKEYISERVQLHKNAEDLSAEALPACSRGEMWEQNPSFAVMKEGRKTAVRVLPSREATIRYMVENGTMCEESLRCTAGYSIVERSGKRTRCEDYCSVSAHCNIFAKYKEERDAKNQEVGS